MILWIFIVLGLLLISYLGYKNWVGRAGEKYLLSIIKAQNEDIFALQTEGLEKSETIRALEIGRDEQEENYEMQFLTFKEDISQRDTTIHMLNKDIEQLEAMIHDHDLHCLPILHETRWKALSGAVENA